MKLLNLHYYLKGIKTAWGAGSLAYTLVWCFKILPFVFQEFWPRLLASGKCKWMANFATGSLPWNKNIEITLGFCNISGGRTQNHS